MKEISIVSGYSEDILPSLIEDDKLSLKIDYKSDFRSAKSLRDIIEWYLNFFNFEKKWISRVILISDELNNNAIEYGSMEGEINSMVLTIDGNNINIEVIDTGNGSEAKTSLEMEEVRESRLNKGFSEHKSIRGRGLFMIITRLVDELYFKDTDKGGLIVGIKKAL